MTRQELLQYLLVEFNDESAAAALRAAEHEVRDDAVLFAVCAGAADSFYVSGRISKPTWQKILGHLEAFSYVQTEWLRLMRPDEFVEEVRENNLIVNTIREWREEEENV